MKDFFIHLWKTLFNNMNVIRGKKKPFYQGLIVVILSLLIAIVPVLTFSLQVNGSDILTNKDNASLDVSLSMFSKYLGEDENAIFRTDENGEFVVNGFDEKKFDANGKNLLTVKVLSVNEDATKWSEHYNEGRTGSLDAPSAPSTTPTNFMLISKDQIQITIFAKGVSNVLSDDKATVNKKAERTFSYVGFAKSYKNKDFSTFYDASVENPYDACVASWHTALDNMFNDYKVSNVLYTTSLYTGLNIIIVLTMALITMILTKIKSAQCEKMTFVQALNCMNWAALCPSIIGMTLGFIFPPLASIAFIICVGIRSVSLGFKASSNQQAKY